MGEEVKPKTNKKTPQGRLRVYQMGLQNNRVTQYTAIQKVSLLGGANKGSQEELINNGSELLLLQT